MKLGKLSLAVVAAASLVAGPVAAQALSPAAHAVSANKVKRIGADRSEESKLGGSMTLIAVLAAAAIIGVIVIASDDDEPTSP